MKLWPLIPSIKVVLLSLVLPLDLFAHSQHKSHLTCSDILATQESTASWALSNVASQSQDQVTFVVTATKESATSSIYKFTGHLQIRNSTKAAERIKKIAFNLKRKHCHQSNGVKKENALTQSVRIFNPETRAQVDLSSLPLIQPNTTLKLRFEAIFDADAILPSKKGDLEIEPVVALSYKNSESETKKCHQHFGKYSKFFCHKEKLKILSCSKSVQPKIVFNSSVKLQSSLSTQGISEAQILSNEIGNGSGTEITSNTVQRKISFSAVPGSTTGTLGLCARLYSLENELLKQNCKLVTINKSPLENPPAETKRFSAGEYCGYLPDVWGAEPLPGTIAQKMHEQFEIRFQSQALQVGSYHMAVFTSAQNVTDYLPSNGPSFILFQSLINPSSSEGSQLLSDVLTMRLNLSGIGYGSLGTYGDLILEKTGTVFDGMSVYQIFHIAQDVLGGTLIIPQVTLNQLHDLIEDLNIAFSFCQPNDWAQTHLNKN